MTTDTSREAVDALLQGVTAGPWWLDGPVWNQVVWSSADNRVCFMAHSNGANDASDIATARFIAAARELVPALRAALDEAEARAERLEAALREAAQCAINNQDCSPWEISDAILALIQKGAADDRA